MRSFLSIKILLASSFFKLYNSLDKKSIILAKNILPMTNATQSGFMLLHKPAGKTSHDMVDWLRKITKIKKIGHAGTLDPFASGLLIMAIGRQATREISGFVKLDKTYEARLKLGEVTDTYDRTGKERTNVLPENWTAPDVSEVDKVLQGFTGWQKQLPPMFSAKKVQGRKLYELARQGEEVEREPVPVRVFEITLLDYTWPCLTVKVHCSSGTYIRTLGYDIGCRLAGGAYVEELKRLAIGKYGLKQAVAPDTLTRDNWQTYLFG